MLKAQDLIKRVTDEVVIEIMKEHGSDCYGTTRDNGSGQKCLWFKTICHGGDSHKLCYFTESKDFFCYTSCGRMTFFNFIKEIQGATDNEFYSKVILYIANKLNIKEDKKIKAGILPKVSKQTVIDIREMEYIIELNEKLEAPKDMVEITKFYDPNILNYFEDKVYKGWLDEGISIETLKKYNIKWYELRNCLVIPHYNIDGKLVGIRRRSFRKADEKNKYMPLYIEGILYEHPLALNLYGLNYNIEAIKKARKVIFVEGEKSVLLSDTYYGKDSITVATCGFNISEWQIKAILDYVDEVYIGFDKDFDTRNELTYKKNPEVYKEFLRYKNRLKALSDKFSGRCRVKLIKDNRDLLEIKDSPFDKGKDTFEKLLKKAKSI